ncbi:hypothetical protein KXX25_009156 [Aspergillus fumigatus]|nr:hypothetical protein KXX21_001289 [Aspergillus fumigatus]KAH1699399.1 hypothetical protein KXX23_008556 [Aspergillus fumigatus]KAH1726568.1 hypothetical protein KXX25_009156 [Aspergillus fumigatus]KAH1734711.1 hypothetical protein KXX40_007439 [Aspergillus fumigatus]KAH1900993.1 hypothetical protein KXW69_001341 [Aspergillus fumigatus]
MLPTWLLSQTKETAASSLILQIPQTESLTGRYFIQSHNIPDGNDSQEWPCPCRLSFLQATPDASDDVAESTGARKERIPSREMFNLALGRHVFAGFGRTGANMAANSPNSPQLVLVNRGVSCEKKEFGECHCRISLRHWKRGALREPCRRAQTAIRLGRPI